MEQKLVICDTNIFIHWFNNDIATLNKLKSIGLENIALSSITVMELMIGMDNKAQMQQLTKKIKNYSVLDFNQSISKISTSLIEHYKLSHNLQIPDAIIAATALEYKLPIFTYNTKDFKFIPDLVIY